MRCETWVVSIGLALIVCLGCGQTAAEKSEADVARGDAKTARSEEMQKFESATNDAYGKMTQVDPDLKQEAMADYDRAIQEDPDNAEAYFARGFARMNDGDAALAVIEDFNKAIELKPDYARAYLMRSRVYESLGETDKAQADRAKAIELDPNVD